MQWLYLKAGWLIAGSCKAELLLLGHVTLPSGLFIIETLQVELSIFGNCEIGHFTDETLEVELFISGAILLLDHWNFTHFLSLLFLSRQGTHISTVLLFQLT